MAGLNGLAILTRIQGVNKHPAARYPFLSSHVPPTILSVSKQIRRTAGIMAGMHQTPHGIIIGRGQDKR